MGDGDRIREEHGATEVAAAWKPLFDPPAAPFAWVPDHTASGRTQALVTLATASIRPVGSKDILAVRQLDAA